METGICMRSFHVLSGEWVLPAAVMWSECKIGPLGRLMLFRGGVCRFCITSNVALEGPKMPGINGAGWQWRNCQTILPDMASKEKPQRGASQGGGDNNSGSGLPLRALQCG